MPRTASPLRAAAAFGLALLLLWALFLPVAEPESHRLAIDARPDRALLAMIAALALLAFARRRLPGAWRWLLATLVFLAALLQLATAVVPGILERELDLYFDLEHVPSLLGLFGEAAGAWRTGLAVAGALLGAAALVAGIATALGTIERVLAPRRNAALLCAGVAVALALVPGASGDRAAAAASRQAVRSYHAWAVLHGYDATYAAILAAPQPPLAALPGLRGRDVLLVFVESYGTVIFDEPRYAQALAPALAGFESTVGRAGYHLLSGRLVSPTFGGGSWLAHGTLASGIRLDPLLARVLPRSERKTLPGYMSAAGYRSVAVMPGMKSPSPQAAFWGFDRSYDAADLGYDGPPFGWFGIPDQYTLRRFAERELAPGHPPLFAQLVLVSSHTPFAPVPPYVEDWADAGAYRSVGQPEWQRIYRQPDWAHLDDVYLQSVAYDLRTLGAWLARLDGDALVIMLGDHQPPDLAGSQRQPWTVPVSVLSRDAALLAPFAAQGYAPGAVPPRTPEAKGMESFLDDFLAAYGVPAVPAGRQDGASWRTR